jgi:Flp pilus assembly protein TadD
MKAILFMTRVSHSRTVGKFSLLFVTLWFATSFAPLQHSSGQSPQEPRQLQRDSSVAASTRRTALVIGNGTYTNAPPLKNPPNDAALVATTLKRLGFEVTVATNRSQREMKQLIREFGQRLRAVGGVGLFYFAGHGVQSNGHNYLIPTEGDIQTEADIEDVGVDVNYVLNLIDDARSSLNIVILDACRNNPFGRSVRSAQNGLAQVRAPTGTLIAYATAPDSTAADGDKANSPYTEELTKQMETPGLVLETMFRRVTEQVSARTRGRQEPWVSDNHKGEFYFKGDTNSRLPSGDAAEKQISTSSDIEDEYWTNIRASDDPIVFQNYLREYPSGKYVTLARQRISAYEKRDDQGISVKEYLTRGILAFDKGHHSEAIAATSKAIALAPDNAGSYFSRGSVYLFGTKEYLKAIADFKKAIEIDPKYFSAYNGLGLSYHNMKEYFTAVVNFSSAIILNPRFAASYSFRADSYEKLGDKEHAAADRAKYNELKRPPK